MTSSHYLKLSDGVQTESKTINPFRNKTLLKSFQEIENELLRQIKDHEELQSIEKRNLRSDLQQLFYALHVPFGVALLNKKPSEFSMEEQETAANYVAYYNKQIRGYFEMAFQGKLAGAVPEFSAHSKRAKELFEACNPTVTAHIERGKKSKKTKSASTTSTWSWSSDPMRCASYDDFWIWHSLSHHGIGHHHHHHFMFCSSSNRHLFSGISYNDIASLTNASVRNAQFLASEAKDVVVHIGQGIAKHGPTAVSEIGKAAQQSGRVMLDVGSAGVRVAGEAATAVVRAGGRAVSGAGDLLGAAARASGEVVSGAARAVGSAGSGCNCDCGSDCCRGGAECFKVIGSCCTLTFTGIVGVISKIAGSKPDPAPTPPSPPHNGTMVMSDYAYSAKEAAAASKAQFVVENPVGRLVTDIGIYGMGVIYIPNLLVKTTYDLTNICYGHQTTKSAIRLSATSATMSAAGYGLYIAPYCGPHTAFVGALSLGWLVWKGITYRYNSRNEKDYGLTNPGKYIPTQEAFEGLLSHLKSQGYVADPLTVVFRLLQPLMNAIEKEKINSIKEQGCARRFFHRLWHTPYKKNEALEALETILHTVQSGGDYRYFERDCKEADFDLNSLFARSVDALSASVPSAPEESKESAASPSGTATWGKRN